MTGVKIATTTNFTEVFSTKAGTVYQNDRECCWYIDFAGKLVRFDYRGLLKLKKSIYRVDIEAAILDSSKTPEIEMVFICACNHCYFLNLLQIISLKELLEGSFAMLELNQILHDRLSRVVI
jgi:ABC-type protease/lipase transport system fused ATPase/permease subunit